MVFMKLQPYIQESVARRSNKKLSFKYYGPFKVMEKIGEVAYGLDLPETSKIHPVLHVSQLKKQVPKDASVTEGLSSVSMDPMKTILPESCLGRRLVKRGSQTVLQVLVKWTNLPKSMATWEEASDIKWQGNKTPA
jgi:hypothetical protein